MKAISIWQPFATLLVKGYKIFETRTWAPPRSVVGQRIGIASTKTIKPDQRAYFQDETFMECYDRLLLTPNIDDLPHGFMLGTAILDSVELMTEEFMEEVSEEEKQYGWWEEGSYAWRMVDPEEFPTPIYVRGQQGIYDWTPPNAIQEAGETPHPQRPQDLRRHLRIV